MLYHLLKYSLSLNILNAIWFKYTLFVNQSLIFIVVLLSNLLLLLLFLKILYYFNCYVGTVLPTIIILFFNLFHNSMLAMSLLYSKFYSQA